MADQLLRIAIVGHTNTGKTSLLRTLTRNTTLGEVSDRPAVTRHVEGVSLLINGQAMLELYDTPGLEDSIGLLEHLDTQSESHSDGLAQIDSFLQGDAARTTYAQEAKTLRQVLASHVALYVIDARERVLGKHRDELEILSRCARPVVPVLNFVASEDNRVTEWREQLARAALHAVAEFDTVVVDDDGERRLFEKVGTLVDSYRSTIDAVIRDREAQRLKLVHGASKLVADMLVDVAAFSETASTRDTEELDATSRRVQEQIREREAEAVRALLQLFRFREDDCRAAELPIENAHWGLDLFSPDALRVLGWKAGRSAATGAMIGLSVDILSAGLTLGTGTALGAALGAAYEGTRAHGRRLVDRMRGRSDIRCAESTLRIVLARQTWLVRALLRRGHAAMEPVELAIRDVGSSKSLPEPLRLARLHRHWSNLGAAGMTGRTDPARVAAVTQLTGWLDDAITAASSERPTNEDSASTNGSASG
ncbi:MAG: GTPase/DUF3482 domain-containing protein [Planctomycetota bacterium]